MLKGFGTFFYHYIFLVQKEQIQWHKGHLEQLPGEILCYLESTDIVVQNH